MKELEIVEYKIWNLLNSKLSNEKIAKTSGFSEKEVEEIREERIEDLTVGDIKKLSKAIDNHDNEVKQNAKNLLNKIKSGDKKSYIIKDKYGIKRNNGTENIHDIYRYKNEDGYYYGVYSDEVSNGQVDSRTNTDDEILKAIEIEIWGCLVEENVQR